MATSGSEKATAVGIFMENGSGGFMSDLEFIGGNAGMIVGSQQFTFRKCAFALHILFLSLGKEHASRGKQARRHVD